MRRALLEPAGELEPDLLEHLEVATRDVLTRALDGLTQRLVDLQGQHKRAIDPDGKKSALRDLLAVASARQQRLAALIQERTGITVAPESLFDIQVKRIHEYKRQLLNLLDTVARTDADVYVTSDLRHHPAAEFVEKGGPALIDVAHWAAESTWLPVVAARLEEALGNDVDTRVSTLCTDPWTLSL